MTLLFAAALLCAERPAAAAEVQTALDAMTRYTQTLAEYSFDFRWSRRDLGVRFGRFDVSPAGTRIAVEAAAGNPEGNRSPPTEFYFDNRRWRAHKCDPATRAVVHVMLFTDPPPIFADFNPIELLGLATSASNSRTLVDTLRSCERLDGFVEGDRIRISGRTRDGDRYEVVFRNAAPCRLVSVEKHLESLKESPVPMRFVRVLQSAMIEGIAIPTRAEMGFRDFNRNAPGIQSGTMEITGFRLSADPRIAAALAKEADSSIPMLDRATGVERAGKVDAAALQKRMASAVEEGKKELAKLAEVQPGRTSAATPSRTWTYVAWAAAAAAALGVAAYVLRRREDAT